MVLLLFNFLYLTGSPLLSFLEPYAANPKQFHFLPSPSLLLLLALYGVGTCWLFFILYLSRLGALDLITGSVLLVVATQEFELGGKNNTISMASFVPLFAILLRAAISMPFNCIMRFLYLYSDI